nr:hypothetical protein HK105_006689 [Polyrhizophydium stewartii]
MLNAEAAWHGAAAAATGARQVAQSAAVVARAFGGADAGIVSLEDALPASHLHPEFMGTFALIGLAALVLNVLMVVSVLRSSVIRTAEYMLNLNLAASDLVFSLTILVNSFVSLIKGSPLVASWAGCQAIAIAVQISTSVSIITVGVLAFHHYSIIILDKPNFGYLQVTRYIIIAWGVALISSVLLYALGGAYVPRPAYLHCHFDYLSPSVSQRISTSYMITLLCGVPLVIGFVYRRIYSKVVSVEQLVRRHLVPSMAVPSNLEEFELQESQNEHHSPTASPPRPLVPAPAKTRDVLLARLHTAELPHKIDSLHPVEAPSSPNAGPTSSKNTADVVASNFSGQRSGPSSSVDQTSSTPPQSVLREAMRNVANRGFFISLVFILSWIPTVFAACLELGLSREVPWLLDASVTTFGALSSVANPIVFFWVDLRLRRSLMELLGISH